MSLLIWVVSYSFEALLCLWLIFWGGAEWVERRFIAGFLVCYFAITWNAEQIKLYTLIMLCAATLWFFLGLFIPALRFT